MFVACGLNHHSASLALREKVALTDAARHTLLTYLINTKAINEGTILSTCNRTELYCDTNEPARLVKELATIQNVPINLLEPHIYIHEGYQGIRHALRVASGLDSMMLGEPQIFGQMKQAYHLASNEGMIKNHLHPVFQYIFSASKRIRTQSGIGHNPVSIASAAVRLVSQLFSNHESLTVLIIGSGETATLVSKYLQKNGVKRFMIASRTHEHATRLSSTLAGESFLITDIPQRLADADIVISATACPLPFITKQWVLDAMKQRHQAPMFFLDLAVPRDIEPAVGDLPSIHLYNIDDLQQTVEQGMDERRMAAQQAEKLVESELEKYIRWHHARQATDIICDYRAQMTELTAQALQEARDKLDAGQCQYQVLSEFSQTLVKKLIHKPTVGFRKAAGDGRTDLLELAHYLYHSGPYEKIT